MVEPYEDWDSDNRQDNYQAISRGHTSSSSSDGTIVFCIHGNKWGVATCCQDLDGPDSEHEPMLGYQSLDEVEKGKNEANQHCHKNRQEGIDKRAQRKLFLACGICFLFMIAEIVGGVLSNSLAIATDAAHLLTDFASFLISMFAVWMAARPKSQRMSFGWHRAEVLGATFSVLLIWLITGIIVYMAVLRVITPDFELNAPVMLITSGLGVCVNLVMGATLHQHGHSHGGSAGHGHSHGGDKENINVKAAFIHVLGDLIQSIGVFIAAIVIYFKPEFKLIDPICTFFFSLIVLATTITILRKTLLVLLEATPLNVSYDIVMSTLLSVKGIQHVHSLRIWGLTTEKNALAAHLVVERGLNAQEVLQEASRKIRSQYDFFEMTLQVEEFHEEMSACDQCKDPIN